MTFDQLERMHKLEFEYNEFKKQALDEFVFLLFKINKIQSDLREFEKERIDPRFKKIEKEIKLLREEFEGKLNIDLDKWKEYYSKVFVLKKPYKCPVCEGKGINKNTLIVDNISNASEIYIKNPSCISCEGKGIVWG